jgi:hypothetical protein
VGVAVEIGVSVETGRFKVGKVPTGVVTTSGVEVGATQPTGVGVRYCPQSDVFPTQELSRMDIAMDGMRSLFTISPTTELYLY